MCPCSFVREWGGGVGASPLPLLWLWASASVQCQCVLVLLLYSTRNRKGPDADGHTNTKAQPRSVCALCSLTLTQVEGAFPIPRFPARFPGSRFLGELTGEGVRVLLAFILRSHSAPGISRGKSHSE